MLGLVHSFLGEFLIFRKKRTSNNLVPTIVEGLKERHVRIIWATWHLASIFGWSLGAIILKISMKRNVTDTALVEFVTQSIAYSMFFGSALVLTATKGKHPGWIVLLAIGILLLTG